MMTHQRPKRVFKIGINLLWLVPGDVGGTEEYAVRLLRELPAMVGDRNVTFEVYATPVTANAHPWLNEVGHVAVSPDPVESRVRRISLEATWLRDAGAECAFVHHLGGTLPLRNRVPALLTVHDLQPFDRPEAFSRAKRAWLQQRLPISIRESTVVMTPTRHVADQIVARFGTSPARLSVVPSSHGWSGDPHPSQPADDQAVPAAKYLLYPAITYRHKNHRVLVDALARLDAGIDLVLTGRTDEAEADLLAQVDRAGLADRVHRLGRVPGPRYEELLAGASALVFPSQHEGFGLPVIEAMVAGVPVIASDLPVLREVAGGAATHVVADDAAAWARAIDAVLARSESERQEVANRGRQRAADFSPSASAQRLLDVYDRTLGLA